MNEKNEINGFKFQNIPSVDEANDLISKLHSTNLIDAIELTNSNIIDDYDSTFALPSFMLEDDKSLNNWNSTHLNESHSLYNLSSAANTPFDSSIEMQENQNEYSSQPIPPRWPSFERMNSQDVYYVIRTILKGFQTEDPYNDDFYYLELNRKSSKLETSSSAAPLPLETENFERRKEKVLMKASEVRTKAWESAHSVLGHYAKSNLKKPRQLISVDFTVDSDSKIGGQKWAVRRSIEDGFVAIIQINDASHRLSIGRGSIEAIKSQIQASREKLTASLGILDKGGDKFDVQEESLLRLVAVTKGKKLFVQALPLLQPSCRDALLIIVFKNLLRFVCSKEYSIENDKVDDIVSGALANSLKDSKPPVKLDILAECVLAIMSVHSVETFPIVLQHKQSSVVIEAVLTMGEIGASKEDYGVEEWRKAFGLLSDMVIAASH